MIPLESDHINIQFEFVATMKPELEESILQSCSELWTSSL
jgi:hypothetical protein